MVATGFLDIPPEIHFQIAEFAETGQALKALSLTSSPLRSTAQSVLFQKLRINIGESLRGSIDDLLANPRICAAIRSLDLHGSDPLSAMTRHSHEEKLSLIIKLFPKTVGLRVVWISLVNISRVFMDALLGIAASIPLQVHLRWSMYPPDNITTPNTTLRISHLTLASTIASHDFYQSVLRSSANTLTSLDVRAEGDVLVELAGIDLPCLRDLTLENWGSIARAAAFITAKRTIRKLVLKGKLSPFPALPPDALPDLRELNAPTELANQLVPGRPVEVIEVFPPFKSDQGWFGQDLARSTARVRKLRMGPGDPNGTILDINIVKQMVTILPSLESLSFNSVGYILPNVVEILASLKSLTHLVIFFCYREAGANRDLNAIVAELRKETSCLSLVEIWEYYGSARWKRTVSVWNEMSDVFHHVESGIVWPLARD